MTGAPWYTLTESGRELAKAARECAAAIEGFTAIWDEWLASLTPAQRAEWDWMAFIDPTEGEIA